MGKASFELLFRMASNVFRDSVEYGAVRAQCGRNKSASQL